MPEPSFLSDDGFAAYKEYMALKQHFTTKTYDYFKYNGKTNSSVESFRSRNDTYSFQRLAKKRDYRNLILSNMVENHKVWVGDLLEERANTIYLDWKKRNDGITAFIQSEIEKMDDDFQNNFLSVDGHYPHVVNLYLRKQISIETLCILTKITNSQEYWSKNVIDNVVFPGIIGKIDKYHPFLVYSTEKVKKVVKDRFF
jgi:hypothetical protein